MGGGGGRRVVYVLEESEGKRGVLGWESEGKSWLGLEGVEKVVEEGRTALVVMLEMEERIWVSCITSQQTQHC